MSCRNIDEKLYELRKCGCNRCRNEYEDIMSDRRYRQSRPLTYIPDGYIERQNTMLATAVDFIKETKVDHPNSAINVLLNKRLVETQQHDNYDTNVKAAQATLDSHTANRDRLAKSLKELNAALKKLGYKEPSNA